MKNFSRVALVFCMACVAAEACETPIALDGNGKPITLSKEELVLSAFADATYVILGDVVEVEEIRSSRIDGDGPQVLQRAAILVRESWKSTKQKGGKLLVLTDISNSCATSILSGSRLLIFANGTEPVALSIQNRIVDASFAAADIAILESKLSVQRAHPLPNKPIQPIAPKEGAPVKR